MTAETGADLAQEVRLSNEVIAEVIAEEHAAGEHSRPDAACSACTNPPESGKP